MFGRPIFLDSMDNQHEQRRRNELLRQLFENQRHGTQLTDLAIPSSRNDGLTLDLNFILLEDAERVQSNEMCLRTNACNRHLLNYIKQMEERYIAMERELIRTKMLIPVLTRNPRAVHQTSQTDIDWEKFSISNKYGHLSASPLGNQCRRNQERTNILSRRKNHLTKKNKDSNGKTFSDTDWTKNRNFSQNLQNDIYPIKDSVNRFSGRKTLTNNSNAAYSSHDAPVFLPQASFQSMDLTKCGQTEPKKCFDLFELQKTSVSSDKTSMEVCQRLDKKHEPETSCRTGLDVKHEDHSQIGCAVNTSEFRPIMEPKFNNDVLERKSELNQQSSSRFEEKSFFKKMRIIENANAHRKENVHAGLTHQSNRNHWKKLPYERSRSINDSARNFTSLPQKQRREEYRTIPTPRSTVHTAYAPMVQPSMWTPILDTNGFTIQLLRLAVLLYAPALMPALNSLIARQNAQTSIPIPCTEGSNDLLTQVFTILNNQQCVPNLPYVSNSRTEENPNSSVDSTSRNSVPYSEPRSENIATQARNENCDTAKPLEKDSIGINTSLDVCVCSSTMMSADSSSSTLLDQTEVNEEIFQKEMKIL